MGSFGAGFTDGDIVDAADLNTIAGAWDSFTVTLTNVSIGNGTATGFYKQIGRTVVYRVLVTFGSTTSVSGSITINLPVTGTASQGVHNVFMTDDSTGTTYPGVVSPNTTAAIVRAINSSATYATQTATSSAIPFTWATSDVIRLTGVYEAAS
jgi:hypothetical protein